MTWPDDRRAYEAEIGVNELDGLIRDREPTVSVNPTLVSQLVAAVDPQVNLTVTPALITESATAPVVRPPHHWFVYEFGDTWGYERCACGRWGRGMERDESTALPSRAWFQHFTDNR